MFSTSPASTRSLGLIRFFRSTRSKALCLSLLFACLSTFAEAQEDSPLSKANTLALRNEKAIADLIRLQHPDRQGPLLALLPTFAANIKNHRAGLIIEQLPADPTHSSELSTAGLFAGPDVRYALVAAPSLEAPTAGSSPQRYTLTYANEVAGTDLIYNVSQSFLQGKARPFDISLAPGELALFCILPFQIEGVQGKVQAQTDRTIYSVEFLSGGAKPIQGQLPLALVEQVHSGAEFVKAYALTDGYGRYSYSLAPRDIENLLEKKSRLKVRSLLCDIQFELPLVTVKPN